MVDREIVVTFFAFQEAMEPQPKTKMWSEFVADLQKGHEILDPVKKEWDWQFNLVEFKPGGKRRNKDVARIHGLVIDYDDNVSIEQALETFGSSQGYEFVLFTSFNHQRKKSTDDFSRDKFRVVLPFLEPMQASKYALYGEFLTEMFARGCDKRLAVASQLYAYLFCPPDTASLAKVIHHPGKWLDWREWPTSLEKEDGAPGPLKTAAQGKAVRRQKLYLEPKDTIRMANDRWIAVEDIDRHISDVYCPFHADKAPGAFVNRSVRGTIYLSCHKCGTAYMRSERAERGLVQFSHAGVTDSTAEVQPTDVEPPGVEEPYDRARRERLLIKACVQGWENRSMLLYAFEGFGKSRLCPLLAQVDRLEVADRVKKRHYLVGESRPCIVFATKTNKQAVEQAEGFQSQVISDSPDGLPPIPLRIQVITGRVHNLKEMFDVDAITDEGVYPWDAGDINQIPASLESDPTDEFF